MLKATFGDDNPPQNLSSVEAYRDVIQKLLDQGCGPRTVWQKLCEQIGFTGTWETDKKGELYHGAFQLVLNVQGKKMNGKWIGFDSQQPIESSDWDWRLISNTIA